MVGDGTGAGSGELVKIDPVAEPVASSSDTAEEAAPAAASAGRISAIGWAVGGAGGFLLGGGSALLVRGRKGRTS